MAIIKGYGSFGQRGEIQPGAVDLSELSPEVVAGLVSFSGNGGASTVSRSDHNHDSTYYVSSVVDAMVAASNAGIANKRMLFPIISGGLYSTTTHGLGQAGLGSGVSLAANTLILTPIEIPVACTLNKIGCYVTAGITGNIRMGIYTLNLSTYVATLVQDCGTTTTNATGNKEVTFSKAVTAGIYWLAALTDVAVPIIQTAASHGIAHHSSYNTIAALAKAVTYGALATQTGVNSASLNMPIMYVGIA